VPGVLGGSSRERECLLGMVEVCVSSIQHGYPSPLPLSRVLADGRHRERGIFSSDEVTQGGARGLADPGLRCGTPLGFSDQSLVASAAIRIDVATVQRIERLVGGDPLTEDQILRFIGSRYGANDLFYLPPHVAAEVCKRPADFIQAAKQYCEPELF
jgi:hypothetical protein